MKKYTFVFIFFVLAVAITPFAVRAQDNDVPKQTVVASEERIEGDYLKAVEALDLSGTVTGDAMVIAGQIELYGAVNGDLMAAGGNLEISGSIGQNLRAIGGNITVNGSVGRNVSITGGNIRFGENSTIVGSTYVAGGNITSRGTHSGDVRIAGGTVIINGIVEGDVEIYAESVVIREEARINGNLIYHSRTEAQISEKAEILGTIDRHELASRPSFGQEFGASAKILFILWSILSSLLFALVVWKLFKGKLSQNLGEGESRFWPKLGWGFVTLIVLPIAATIAFVTIIGIPLAMSAFAIYFVLIYSGFLLGAALFGRWLLALVRYSEPTVRFPWVSLVVGIVVVSVISPVPFIGFMVKFIITLWGFGTLILQFKRQ